MVSRTALLSIRALHSPDRIVVLVGGSTRIPKIQSMLSEFFNGKEPLLSVGMGRVQTLVVY